MASEAWSTLVPISTPLGVTLYELLTLRPAFKASDRKNFCVGSSMKSRSDPRTIQPFDSPRPGDDHPQGHGEGAVTTLRLGARTGRRPETRFLDDQPIQARRPSLFDQTAKWSRRHRPVVVASTIALFVTLAISTAVLWEANRRLTQGLEFGAHHLNHSVGTLDQIIQPLTGDIGAPSVGVEARRTLGDRDSILRQSRGDFLGR